MVQNYYAFNFDDSAQTYDKIQYVKAIPRRPDSNFEYGIVVLA